MRLCLLVILLVNTLLLLAQNTPHPAYRQYTTDDGLASPETYQILQDKTGYIWIATDNGVSCFDGYEFRNYGVKEGLKENVIFMMQFDTLGRLWMQAKSGNLYYMEGEIIHPYWYNSVLDDFPGRPEYGKGFIVEGAGETVHISTLKYGLISILKNGDVLPYIHNDSIYHQVFEKNDIAIYSKFIKGGLEGVEARNSKQVSKGQYYPIYFYVNNEIWPFSDLDDSQDLWYNADALSLGQGQFLFKIKENVWLIENGKVLWKTTFKPRIQYAGLMNKGQLYLGLYGHQGLAVYKSLSAFLKGEKSIRLPGKTVNHFMEDKEGGRWFATNEDGVFYAPADAYLVNDRETGLTDEKVTALAVKSNEELFIGLENGEVWQLNPRKESWHKLPEIPGSSAVKDLYFDQQYQQLWVGRNYLYQWQNNNWKLCAASNKEPIVAYRITASPDGKRLYIGNYKSAMRIALPDNTVDTIYIKTGQQSYAVREDFGGRVWIGKADGLFEWQKDTLTGRQNLHPGFSLRIEDIALMPDSTLVVATKGGGLVFWKGDEFEKITTVDGLTTDMMECVHADDKGNVWAGTLNGLNRISGAFNNREVKKITVFHGLPSNEINRICTIGDTVWIATNKGLVQFLNKNTNHAAPKPILASVLANHDSLDLSKTVPLSANKNNLSISYFAINYKMKGKIQYQFRMDKGDWTPTMNRSVNFPALPPGKRFFEVQAQNEDGIWSESKTFQFVIDPPWWATWWAITGAIIAGLLLVLGVYKYRTAQLKRANKIQLKIAELERSALQAQMNPHFIFNCLNSIQNFILQNEKESAIMYLGSFASLVRSMLNASVAGKIPLDEEMKLLNNYLELEKLRFKNRFNYEIRTAEGLDLFDIKIPPLLVQPYVENALKHGISGKTSGGKVDVFFKEKDAYLEVSIMDNGTGIKTDEARQNNSKSHKSFGMAITKNRLELLGERKGGNPVSTSTLYDDKGQVVGTQVIIRIGINE
jgi:ligand-binding sensor domain-containing protein